MEYNSRTGRYMYVQYINLSHGLFSCYLQPGIDVHHESEFLCCVPMPETPISGGTNDFLYRTDPTVRGVPRFTRYSYRPT